MEPGSTALIRAARVLLLVLFAFNLYRAAMLSVTPPEAVTYNRFVGPSLQDAAALTSANNHVLNTMLARISTSIFHLTDLALRLPSLLGGLLYFWAVFRLARRAFGGGPLFLAAVALLSLNPLVLDYLSMARGYGFALAFWLWALQLMVEHLDSDQPVRGAKLNLAGVCLGLSISSNLAFMVPAGALAATFSLLPESRRSARRFQDLWLPAFITAFVFLVVPLNHLDTPSFRWGATSLRQTLNSLTALSLNHGNPAGTPPFLAGVVRVGVGALAVAILFLAVRRGGNLRYLLAGTVWGGLVGLQLAHRILGVPFPVARSGLYMIPLLTLGALCLVQWINRRPAEWAVLLVSAVYLLQLNVNRYGEWREYARARDVVKAIRQDAHGRPVRVGASMGLDQVLNYYRARYALGAWAPVESGPGSRSFDYYALNQADAGLVAERRLQVIWRNGDLIVAR